MHVLRRCTIQRSVSAAIGVWSLQLIALLVRGIIKDMELDVTLAAVASVGLNQPMHSTALLPGTAAGALLPRPQPQTHAARQIYNTSSNEAMQYFTSGPTQTGAMLGAGILSSRKTWQAHIQKTTALTPSQPGRFHLIRC